MGPRTPEGMEFGIENYNNQQNCFLNAVLQSFWHLKSARQFLLYLCQSNHEGPASLKPLVDSIK